MAFELKELKKYNCIFIKATGDITSDVCEEFEEMVKKAVEIGSKYYIYDLKDSDFICSEGIGIIAYNIKNTVDLESKIIILNLSENNKRLFEITNMNELVDVLKSTKELEEKYNIKVD